MNIELPTHIDKPTFLAWVQGREERYELVRGRVVMMVGASRNHGRIVTNLVGLLLAQLDRREWEVIADFGLDAGPDTLRYPDIVVDRAGGGGRDYTASMPVLLIEVLSPSSIAIDLRDKAAEYRQLPSLNAYVVFSQDEPKAWVWERSHGEFPLKPRESLVSEEIIRIEAPRAALSLAVVYAGGEIRLRTAGKISVSNVIASDALRAANPRVRGGRVRGMGSGLLSLPSGRPKAGPVGAKRRLAMTD
jgi:Uma2 family endonuclease